MSDAHARVRDAAAARGLDIEIRERPNARSLQEAADILGIDASGIVKTLVVKRSDGTYLFALVPGGRAISWPKLRAVVGVNKLRLPEAELALEATGYERGTITPIGSSTDWPVYADASITGRRIAMGAGATASPRPPTTSPITSRASSPRSTISAAAGWAGTS